MSATRPASTFSVAGEDDRPRVVAASRQVEWRAAAVSFAPVQEAAVVRWRKYGKDRLYVNATDGTRLGWRDLLTGADNIEPGPPPGV